MEKIKIGVLCPSEIAFRRFMPALKKTECFEFSGISAATFHEWYGTENNTVMPLEYQKAEKFTSEYGGKIFNGYSALISSKEIDAVYIPLPPGLHYKWARKALENNKHVLLEKPFTTSLEDTEALVKIAKEKNLALHENYMFVFHSQLDFIKEQLEARNIGDIRLIRIDFGFPFRGANDFRYDKGLGGGALLDCGGYTIKLASMLLGSSAKIAASNLNYKESFDVDIYGSATLVNDSGLTAQVSFGMDNSYRCSLDIWGSSGSIYTNRILTAPDGYEPEVVIKTAGGDKTFKLKPDDTFKKSIENFAECINDIDKREKKYCEIYCQSQLVSQFIAHLIYTNEM